MRLLLNSCVLGVVLSGAILAGQGATPFAARAEAASFDCTRARAADERAICGNRALEDRDVKLSTMFALVPRLVGMGARGAIQDDQRAWLTQRSQCGGNIACIRASYDRRIATLQRQFDDIASRGPF